MANDDLHQNTLGSYTIVATLSLADAIKRLCPAQSLPLVDASDL